MSRRPSHLQERRLRFLAKPTPSVINAAVALTAKTVRRKPDVRSAAGGRPDAKKRRAISDETNQLAPRRSVQGVAVAVQ